MHGDQDDKFSNLLVRAVIRARPLALAVARKQPERQDATVET